jgi:hypothetical protein
VSPLRLQGETDVQHETAHSQQTPLRSGRPPRLVFPLFWFLCISVIVRKLRSRQPRDPSVVGGPP